MVEISAWHYECKHKSKLHKWLRKTDKTAVCIRCKATLTVQQYNDCFTDRS